jgi:hypothetical protein
MEELRQQLAETIPTAATLMARELGLSYSELIAIIEKGELSAGVGLKALFQGLEKSYGGSADKLAQTWEGLVGQLKTSWSTFVIEVADTGVWGRIKEILGGVVGGLKQDITSGVFKDLAGDLGRVWEKILAAIKPIAMALFDMFKALVSFAISLIGMLDNLGLYDAFAEALKIVGLIIKGWAEIFKLIAEAARAIQNFFTPKDSDVEKQIKSLEEQEAAIKRQIQLKNKLKESTEKEEAELERFYKKKKELMEQELSWWDKLLGIKAKERTPVAVTPEAVSLDSLISDEKGKAAKKAEKESWKDLAHEAKAYFDVIKQEAKAAYDEAKREAKEHADHIQELERKKVDDAKNTEKLIRELRKDGLSEALSDLKKLASETKKLNDDRFKNQESTEEKLLAAQRKAMTEEQAWYSKKKQAEETLAQARAAASKLTANSTQEEIDRVTAFYRKAQEQFAAIDGEVKNKVEKQVVDEHGKTKTVHEEKTVVTKEQASKASQEGIRAAGSELEAQQNRIDAIKAQKRREAEEKSQAEFRKRAQEILKDDEEAFAEVAKLTPESSKQQQDWALSSLTKVKEAYAALGKEAQKAMGPEQSAAMNNFLTQIVKNAEDDIRGVGADIQGLFKEIAQWDKEAVEKAEKKMKTLKPVLDLSEIDKGKNLTIEKLEEIREWAKNNPTKLALEAKEAVENLKGFQEKLKALDGSTVTVNVQQNTTTSPGSSAPSEPGAETTKRWGGLIFARGGKLPGFGGGDRIRALLEAGEYVIRKEAVARYGAPVFEALNNMHLSVADYMAPVRKFAEGGFVPAMAGAGPSRDLGTLTLNVGGQSFNVMADDAVAASLTRHIQKIKLRRPQ